MKKITDKILTTIAVYVIVMIIMLTPIYFIAALLEWNLNIIEFSYWSKIPIALVSLFVTYHYIFYAVGKEIGDL